MAPDISKSRARSSQPTAEEWRLATLVHSAIAGVSLAAIVQLANSQSQPPLLLFASILFALALPSSVASVVMLQYFQARNNVRYADALLKHPFWSRISSLLAVIAQLACFGGVLLLFWHLHWIAGAAFAFTSLIAIMTVAALSRK